MRAGWITFGILLSCISQASAASVFSFTPAAPELFTINFGSTSLPDGTVLPAFTFSFDFNYALTQSNYGSGFQFQMDNSEINPNTSSAFSPAPITIVSSPTLTATTVGTSGKSSWGFRAATSYLMLSNTNVSIVLEYDPPMTSVIFQLNPNGDLLFIPTIETPSATESGAPTNGSGTVGTTTLVETPTPEPGSLWMLAAGFAFIGAKIRR
jgi:hypothetical protein